MSLLDLFNRERELAPQAPKIVSYYTQLISDRDGWLGYCPLCSSREFSFTLTGTRWQCVACKQSGGLVDLVAKVERLARQGAQERLTQLANGNAATLALAPLPAVMPQAELTAAQVWHEQLTADPDLCNSLWNISYLFGSDRRRLRLGVATAWREGYESLVLTLPVTNAAGRVVSYVAWCWLADRLGARWLPGGELPNYLPADPGYRETLLCVSGDELVAAKLSYAALLVVPPTLLAALVSLHLAPGTYLQVLLPPALHLTHLFALAGLVDRDITVDWLFWPVGKEQLAELSRAELAQMQACAMRLQADGKLAEPDVQIIFGNDTHYVNYYAQREEARLALGLSLTAPASRSTAHQQHRAGVEQRLAVNHPDLFPALTAAPASEPARVAAKPASSPLVSSIATPPPTLAQWIIEGLLPVGLSFLISEMPSGLPAMLATLAVAVAEGKSALQQFAVAGGSVLYLTSDGSRLYHGGSRVEHWLGHEPELLTVFNWYDRFDHAGLSKLAAELDKGAYKLVVVDEWDIVRPSLSRVGLADERSSLQQLRRLARQYGLAVLVGHLLPRTSAGGGDWLAGLSYEQAHAELDGLLAMRRTNAAEVGVSADGLLYVNHAGGSNRHLLYYASRKTHRWRVRSAE